MPQKRRKFGRRWYWRLIGYDRKSDAKQRAKQLRIVEGCRARVVPEKSSRRGGKPRWAVYYLER